MLNIWWIDYKQSSADNLFFLVIMMEEFIIVKRYTSSLAEVGLF